MLRDNFRLTMDMLDKETRQGCVLSAVCNVTVMLQQQPHNAAMTAARGVKDGDWRWSPLGNGHWSVSQPKNKRAGPHRDFSRSIVSKRIINISAMWNQKEINVTDHWGSLWDPVKEFKGQDPWLADLPEIYR